MPISKLAHLHTNLACMLDAGYLLLQSLEKTKSNPYLLNEAAIRHLRRSYNKQQEEIKIYQSILTQWLEDENRRQQSEKLKAFGTAIHTVVTMQKQVFFLIDFFEEHAIEQTLIKDDPELPMDLLHGEAFLPGGLDQVSAQSTVVHSKLIACEKCGNLVTHLVFAENSTIENIEHHAVIMDDIIKRKNVDTWIIGESLETQGDDALAYIMKTWLQKGKPIKMLLSDFLHALNKEHC